MIKKNEGQQASGAFGALPSKISQLKKEIQASRFASVREKIERNRKTVETSTFELCELSKSKNDLCSTDQNGITDKLSFRMTNPLREISGYIHGYGEKDTINCQEITFSTTIKLPHVEKIPPYTSWIFLDKNQRMAEDQSVVGRRQIYYDENGGETLISSDSEEEIPEPEEEKHKFSDGEDQMLWKVLQEYGLMEEVVNSLCQFIDATSFEIQERYNILMEKYQHKHVKKVSDDSPEMIFERSTFLDKSLDATLDSIDNLFCRRCLVFDCRLHGCSQTIIVPVEKQPYWSEVEENREPCSDQCCLLTRSVTDLCKRTDTNVLCTTDASKEKNRNVLSSGNEKPSRGNLYRDITPDVRDNDGMGTDISSGPSMVPQVSHGALCNDELSTTTPSSENLEKRKVSTYASINATLAPYDSQASSNKKQKKISCTDVYVSGDDKPDSGMISKMDTRLPGGRVPGSNLSMKMKHGKELVEHRCHGTIASDRGHNNIVERDANNDPEASDMEESANSQAVQVEGALNSISWRPLEKELYLKGIEIFGKNSCLISRNLLCGLKTCIEVFTYMLKDGNAVASATLPNSSMEDNENADTNYKQHELSSRSRFFRRRGRARKLKYTSKSGAHPSTHKRIAGGKNKWNKQYTPCECKFMCGKECPCFQNVTCCEKYCGCSKSCKYRFRGCHCAKSQCRSRQCPCFAADRECDPDVCRNCWVSCGDGSLGEPPARGEDGYHCENMKLLLKQQQRILLGRSDVAGWGAFLKNSVHKNEYLGEYTGELISHKEADKRGKIYDRANSSYLFDLNDQSVLDAYRKGDKLKFANHSAKPNCYAKVKLVAGDHRVGIYAMENIEAGEELFYDYCYAPDTQYAWARKAESSKRDESPVYTGRARKHQSS